MLFATKDGWNEKGGEAAKAPFKLCLVVSRPCVVVNKPQITVAGIEKYSDDAPKEANTFGKVLDFMTGARDGVTSPDVFYLGHLPGHQGRYCARLDWLHTVGLPTDPATREAFLAKRRVAALNPDFLRALHTRLFGSFASLGFDDHAWPSTEDLAWIVSQGQADIAKLDAEMKQLQAQQALRTAEAKQFDEKQLTKTEKELTILRAKVRPYEDELNRRRTTTALPVEQAGLPRPEVPASSAEPLQDKTRRQPQRANNRRGLPG
jgi:hypothetical protein